MHPDPPPPATHDHDPDPDVDVDEYMTFIGLMHAARCETQRGRVLWEEKTLKPLRLPTFHTAVRPRARAGATAAGSGQGPKTEAAHLGRFSEVILRAAE